MVYNFYSLHEVAFLKSYQYTVFMGAFFSLDNIIRSARAKIKKLKLHKINGRK